MQRTFCSAQEFLDYDAPTRLAKTALIHHLVDCRSCLGRIGRDDYSFTERKPISFNDERKLEPVTKPERVAATFKCARPRCWNSALMHQFLRENFGGFESCGRFGRPKNAQTFLSKQIDNTGGERVIGADHRQIHMIFLSEANEGCEISYGNRHILSDFGSAGVSRRTKNALCAWRLFQFPCERVFAATAANDKDFHSERLDCRDSRAGRETRLDFRTTVIAREQVIRPAR